MDRVRVSDKTCDQNVDGGFTLIELMVVVAILGILVTIAYPNYQKYISKSRQSEVRIALAAAFTAEKSFFTSSGSFSGCLAQIGYAPDGVSSTHYYTVGIQDQTGTVCGPDQSESCMDYSFNAGYQATCSTGAGYTLAGEMENPSATLPSGASLPGAAGASAISTMAFSLGGAGQISNTTTAYDLWTIDANKLLINVTPNL